jgi:tetratricopeptide (TPR) repeat protein
MGLSSSFIKKLDDALVGRRVDEGFRLLDHAGAGVWAVTRKDPHAWAFLLSVAQWVDLGYGKLQLLEDLLKQLSGTSRRDMKLIDFLRLRLSEAFAVFASDRPGETISILEQVLTLETEVCEPRLLVVTHFWKARAHRKKGEYEPAMRHISMAKEIAERMHAPKLVAVMKIHESWLLFQRGQRKEAFRMLDEAEAALKPLGHTLSLGNIESARGRFVRRSGEYGKALEHFHRAITIYSKHFANHPNLARAMVNAAYVKRLIALDLSRKSETQRASGAWHARHRETCQEALELLYRAREIYAQHNQHSGMGSALVNTGHLHLHGGEIDPAVEAADSAFSLGEETRDNILMARARILQAAIENMKVEEQLGEAGELTGHANMARQYAEEAIRLAGLTQNKRLLAGAFIMRGSVAANEVFEEWDVAKQFASQATDLLSPDDRDHLFSELLALKTRILRAIGIDETLRSWSDGMTGGKSFQQITEEFAEIVIPKVWVREGRKISKVAEKMAISPKKVRRVLRNAHLLN